jgi:hypothetical protein
MLGRIAYDQLSVWYSQLERATLFSYLTEMETTLIEEGLKEEVQATQSQQPNDEDVADVEGSK